MEMQGLLQHLEDEREEQEELQHISIPLLGEFKGCYAVDLFQELQIKTCQKSSGTFKISEIPSNANRAAEQGQ
eukprot:12621163-Ditylum_brightwellii.AAC.1